jgi:arylformamidase
MSESLNKHSVIVASLGYTIAPECNMTKIVELVELGFIKIVNKAIESNSKIIICGHSAGAHLATSLMFVDYFKKYNLNDSCISGIVLVSGIYNLIPLLQTEVNINLKMDKNEAEKLSYFNRSHFELTNECLKNIQVLIAYGEFDPPSFKQQSIDFAQVNFKFNL